MICTYVGLFVSIRRTRGSTPLANPNDMDFVLRFFFIVLTNIVIFPSLLKPFESLTKTMPNLFSSSLLILFRCAGRPSTSSDFSFCLSIQFQVTQQFYCFSPRIHLIAVSIPPIFFLYADEVSIWVVVFVVPINAAIDPILYTFTTPKFRRLLAQIFAGTTPASFNNSSRRFETSSFKYKDQGCTQPMISPQHRRMSWDHNHHGRHPAPRYSRDATAGDPSIAVLDLPSPIQDPSSMIEMTDLQSPAAGRRNSF